MLTLTQLLHVPVLAPGGEKLGRLEDLIVRLADTGYPPVTGLKARVGGRDLFVPVQMVKELGREGARLEGQTLNLGRFERRPGEVLLREDLLDRRLIYVAGGRLIHANDLLMAGTAADWRLVGVDRSPRGVARRLLPRSLRQEAATHVAIIDWKDVQPFVGHVPSAGLLMPLGPLRRLHPAQIADLVEGVPHDQGEEIIEAVEGDPELSADVFEELDLEHQVEFARTLTDEEAATLLARMAPDDAADLVTHLDQERRQRVLDLVPRAQRAKLRALLQHNPSTAGGLMSPDFVSVSRGATLAQALERVRADDRTPVQLLGSIFVTEPDGRLLGTVGAFDLIRHDAALPIDSLPGLVTAQVRVEADLQDVALVMADYNLTAIPVTDRDGRLIGAVSVDDILESLVPEQWRRRAEAAPER